MLVPKYVKVWAKEPTVINLSVSPLGKINGTMIVPSQFKTFPNIDDLGLQGGSMDVYLARAIIPMDMVAAKIQVYV